MKLGQALSATNLAEDLDKELLIQIGDDVVNGYELDLQSREPWEKDLKNWTELALQVTTNKT